MTFELKGGYFEVINVADGKLLAVGSTKDLATAAIEAAHYALKWPDLRIKITIEFAP